MFFSGIADEAASDIETQIKAHGELGWQHIEIRNVSSTNLTDVDDAEFERIAGLLGDAGLQVSCFAVEDCMLTIFAAASFMSAAFAMAGLTVITFAVTSFAFFCDN